MSEYITERDELVAILRNRFQDLSDKWDKGLSNDDETFKMKSEMDSINKFLKRIDEIYQITAKTDVEDI